MAPAIVSNLKDPKCHFQNLEVLKGNYQDSLGFLQMAMGHSSTTISNFRGKKCHSQKLQEPETHYQAF